MSSSPHHFHHLKEKNVRKAQSEEVVLKDIKAPNSHTVKENITSPKVAIQNRGRVGSRRTSKRTAPETVTVDTEPQHIHKEGLHWIRTLRKQITNQTRKLSKKLMSHVKRYRKK